MRVTVMSGVVSLVEGLPLQANVKIQGGAEDDRDHYHQQQAGDKIRIDDEDAADQHVQQATLPFSINKHRADAADQQGQ